jgi:hypothetical protein
MLCGIEPWQNGFVKSARSGRLPATSMPVRRMKTAKAG